MAHNLAYNIDGSAQFFNVGGPAWHGLGQTFEEKVTVEHALEIVGGNYDVIKGLGIAQNGPIQYLTEKEVLTLNPQTLALQGVTIAPVELMFWGDELKEIKEKGFSFMLTPITPMDTFNNEGPTGRKWATIKKTKNPNDQHNGRFLGGVVGDGYTIIPNSAAIGFFQKFIDLNDAVIVSAGVIGRGNKFFLTAKLPESVTFMGDELDRYVVLLFTHDGSEAVRVFFSSIRVVCENTFHFALNRAKSDFASNMQTIRHSGNGEEMLKQAPRLMGLQSNFYQQMQSALGKTYENKFTDNMLLKAWSLIYCDHKEIAKIARAGVSQDNIIELLSTRKGNMFQSFLDYYFTGPGQEKIIGNGYGFYNGVNGYVSNVRNYNTGDKDSEQIAQSRFNYIFGGQGQQRIETAFELAYMPETINARWSEQVTKGYDALEREAAKIKKEIDMGVINLNQAN